MWRQGICASGTVFRKIVKEATGQDQPLYKVMEKMARTGRDLNSERTESRKIKVETTFDGTRVNPEKSGSITQVSSENFTPEDFCYGVLKGMSTELYQMYMTIQKGTGIKIRRMIGSGNGLRKIRYCVKLLKICSRQNLFWQNVKRKLRQERQ